VIGRRGNVGNIPILYAPLEVFGAMSSRTPPTHLPSSQVRRPFQIDPDFENGIKDELH
jgi:hypothetical protein